MSEARSYRRAGPDDRLLIVGQNGSGKTVEMLHAISQADFDERPLIVLDFKGDDLLAAMPVSGFLDLDSEIPDDPGIYLLKAPVMDEKATVGILTRAYHHGDVMICCDETRQLGALNRGLILCLTMGRSRRVGMILAAQVPVRICTDARDEATFIQIFNLLDIDDRKTMQRYIPRKYDIVDHDLPKYHSLYYDVRADHLVMLPPGPEPAESYRQILDRLPIVEEEKPPELPRRHRV